MRYTGVEMIDRSKSAALGDVQDFRPCEIPLPDLETPSPGEVHLWFLDLGGLAGSLRTPATGPGHSMHQGRGTEAVVDVDDTDTCGA